MCIVKLSLVWRGGRGCSRWCKCSFKVSPQHRYKFEQTSQVSISQRKVAKVTRVTKHRIWKRLHQWSACSHAKHSASLQLETCQQPPSTSPGATTCTRTTWGALSTITCAPPLLGLMRRVRREGLCGEWRIRRQASSQQVKWSRRQSSHILWEIFCLLHSSS